MLIPSKAEQSQRTAVLAALRDAISRDERVLLPPSAPLDQGGEIAMVRVGEEPNSFGGTVGPYRYQFEGEDDLLHLMVVRQDYASLSVEEGQTVASFVLPKLIVSLMWLKPGTISQHFYLAHDLLRE